MNCLEISLNIERVAIDEVATLFEQSFENGYSLEDIDHKDNQCLVTFYTLEGQDFYDATNSIEECREKIEHVLAEKNISTFGFISVVQLENQSWLTGWKEYIEPLEILPDLWVVPRWKEVPTEAQGKNILRIESSLTFGTGTHATTQSCAYAIALYGRDKQRILDVGTGTGILLMISYFLAPEASLSAIDIDEKATEECRDNLAYHNIEAQVITGHLDEKAKGTYDLILANLTVDPLKELLSEIPKSLENNGILIVSGIIAERKEEFLEVITQSWTIVEEIQNGSWFTYVLQRGDVL